MHNSLIQSLGYYNLKELTWFFMIQHPCLDDSFMLPSFAVLV